LERRDSTEKDTFAPVVQRIEQARPKGLMSVQFWPGAQNAISRKVPRGTFLRFVPGAGIIFSAEKITEPGS